MEPEERRTEVFLTLRLGKIMMRWVGSSSCFYFLFFLLFSLRFFLFFFPARGRR